MKNKGWWAIKHGHCRNHKNTPTFSTWSHMLSRCCNQNNNRWYRYGGRGIKVCARWLVFVNFLADMGEKPKGLSIDRIDNDGNYEPGNYRWATPIQQKNNASSNRMITFKNKTQSMANWAREVGIRNATLWERLRMGMSVEDALTKPISPFSRAYLKGKDHLAKAH